MKKIAVLVSGSGTNLQAIIDAVENGGIRGGHIACVISSKAGVKAIERAANHGIPAKVIARMDFPTAEEYNNALLAELDKFHPDLIVLAGFLSILGAGMIHKYQGRIMNVHPALIPSFCGKGYYGLAVHKAALDYGVKVTGATVHFVNDVIDGGKIILQKAVEINPDDTPSTLQKRVMEEAEWIILPRAIDMFCNDLI